MKAPLVAATLVGAALLVSSEDARAAGHANGFGEKGELIISADRLVPLFGYTHSSVEVTTNLNNGDTRSTSSNSSAISLLFGRDLSGDGTGQPIDVHMIPRVAFDVTIIDHLTLGAGLAIAFGLGGSFKTETQNGPTTTVTTKQDAPTLTAFGIAPRVGYILPIGEHFAFWPRLGFAFYSVSGSTETRNAANNTILTTKLTDTTFSLDLDPQFAIIPTEHFFINFGPIINVPITGSRSLSTTVGATSTDRSDDTTIFHLGLQAGIGGWLNVF